MYYLDIIGRSKIESNIYDNSMCAKKDISNNLGKNWVFIMTTGQPVVKKKKKKVTCNFTWLLVSGVIPDGSNIWMSKWGQEVIRRKNTYFKKINLEWRKHF